MILGKIQCVDTHKVDRGRSDGLNADFTVSTANCASSLQGPPKLLSPALFFLSKMYCEEEEDVEEEAHEENQQDFQRAGFVVRDAIVNAFFN